MPAKKLSAKTVARPDDAQPREDFLVQPFGEHLDEQQQHAQDDDRGFQRRDSGVHNEKLAA